MANIKVKGLSDTSTVSVDNQVMVLTNDERNQVQNITIENLLTNVISADTDNVIEQTIDGKLFVETPEIITGDLEDLTTSNKYNLVGAINEVDSDISTETTNRVNADNNLQSQIDAITAASDVTDIVGTYADLEDYDTTGLADNSIIKVLRDENENNATTYYRWVITGGVGAWVLIGQEGPYYTISQADNKFATQLTTGNLSNLDTTDKTSLVSAINEAYALIPATSQKDYIDNSKGVLSGDVSTNNLILPQIQSYAHSTFDMSKFTVTGSPVITDDGIASGFSSDNRVRASISVLGSKLVAQVGFYYKVGSANGCPMSINESSTSKARVYISTNGSIVMPASSASSEQLVVSTTDMTFSVDDFIIATLEVADNSAFKLTLLNLTTGQTITKTSTSTWTGTVANITRIDYGDTAGYLYYPGRIDLKYSAIFVDGIPIFSGNRTGIDTIKSDDYTVVGTPTISADGVASGFSSSNYITVSSFPTLNNYTIEGEFTTPATLDDTIPLGIGTLVGGNITLLFSLRYNSNNRIRLLVRNTGGTNTELPTSHQASTNTGYKYKIIVNGANCYFYIDNALVGSLDNFCELLPTIIVIGADRNYGSAFSGSIDLNAFKIYVDGNLVYQPCLKIPYTESKTGSKIVDSYYRARVADMYGQFGYAPYYTLSDSDFTLPQGELYGMIERKFDIATATTAEKEAIISYLMPDWAKAVAQVVGTEYTADKRGWVQAQGTCQRGSITLTINSNVVAYAEALGTQDTSGFGCCVPVDIGDKYQLTKTDNNDDVVLSFNFIPCKGEN